MKRNHIPNQVQAKLDRRAAGGDRHPTAASVGARRRHQRTAARGRAGCSGRVEELARGLMGPARVTAPVPRDRTTGAPDQRWGSGPFETTPTSPPAGCLPSAAGKMRPRSLSSWGFGRGQAVGARFRGVGGCPSPTASPTWKCSNGQTPSLQARFAIRFEQRGRDGPAKLVIQRCLSFRGRGCAAARQQSCSTPLRHQVSARIHS